jgi:signal transduction histidine kinase
MKLLAKERISSVGAILVLTGILVVLATMQFRWSKEISKAASVRMHADLQSSMVAFRQDFNRELSTDSLAIQPETALNAKEKLSAYADRIDAWRRTASHPDLVADVYVWNPSAPSSTQLLKLNFASRQFQPADWPLNFSQLRDTLTQRSSDVAELARHLPSITNQPRDDARRQPRNGPGFEPSLWSAVQTIPALVHPLLERRSSLNQPSTTPGWLIVQLSSDVLQGHLLPELAERYFRGPEGFVYRIAVLGGDESGRLVYSSDSDFGKSNIQAADASINLIGPPSFGTGPGPAGTGATSRFGFFGGAGRGAQPAVSEAGDRRFPDHGTAALPRIEPLRVGADYGGWRLAVQHRDGSLEAAVNSLWRRNLIISLCVLLVLAATTGLMAISAHRAQRLARLQMDFVTGVSHELRTPLAVISSAAENIADGVVDNKQQMVRYGNVIKTQCRQLMSLVEQLLLFAATREKRYRYDLRVLDVKDVVDSALSATSGVISSAGFAVEQYVEPGLPKVKGDLTALSQALQNLITNAVKYGDRSRWLGIWARAGETELNEIQIMVEDRGSGISSGELQHIFEPFYRSPSATASQIHGTGLGLPLAKNIAEAMGGRITATSAPGTGSTFVLHLPIAEVYEPPAESHEANVDEVKVTHPA